MPIGHHLLLAPKDGGIPSFGERCPQSLRFHVVEGAPMDLLGDLVGCDA
jgi:hypothetical protein